MQALEGFRSGVMSTVKVALIQNTEPALSEPHDSWSRTERVTRHPIRCRLIRVLILLGLITFSSTLPWAQGGTAELTGLVTDQTGAVVAGAEATLTNLATGGKRIETTSSAGTYRFVALPVVGSYNLDITAEGFKKYKIANIVISVGTVTTHDAKLEVGTQAEQMTVEGGSQLVQAEDSSISGLVDRHVWQDMPLETRSQNEFIELLPGAEPAGVAQITDRGAAVNGARSGTGNFLVDGFDNNDQGLGGGAVNAGPGGALTTISPDAIQEYRVIEHLAPAEYGKSGGFVTDTVLKSGTNQWHGSLFEYNRVQALAANSFFSNRAEQQDHLIRNQFGGSVGGPIVKDKTFFFFTVEAHRLRENTPLTAPTITPDFVNFVQSGAFEQFMEGTGPYTGPVADPSGKVDAVGLCPAFLGTSCPSAFAQDATLGPVWRKIYAAEPLPWCTPGAPNCTALSFAGQSLYAGGFLGPQIIYPINAYGTITLSQPTSFNQMRYSGKFDQKIGAQDQLNAAYLYDNADQVTAFAGGPNAIGATSYFHGRQQNVGVTWSHTFSPTILNQARMAFVRSTGDFPPDPRVAGMPSISTYWDSPTFGFGSSGGTQFFSENEFIYKDDLSVTHGKHNFKGGGEYRRLRNNGSFDLYEDGVLSPQGTEDLLTDETFSAIADNLVFGGPTYGSLANAEASINPITGQLPNYFRGFRANEWAAYIQDDWRIHPRLTLNLGARWEYFGPPHNFQPGLDANFYTGVPVTPFPYSPPTGVAPNPFIPLNNPVYAGFATGTVEQRNHNIWNKDLNNFGPRVGFAYNVKGASKLVLRGGFGIMYDRMYNNIFENIRFNPPSFADALLGPFGGNGTLITPAQTTALNTYPFTGTSTFAGVGLTPALRAIDQNLVTAYYEQANFGFQYALAKDLVLESNYVGTFGHKLLGIIDANTYNGRFACSAPPYSSGPCSNTGSINGFDAGAINPNYSDIDFRNNCCDSNYSGWQTTLSKRFTSGLQFNINYTFSKALDDVSDTFGSKNTVGFPTDNMNPHFDYGPADFNVKHRVVASFIYRLPFGGENRWLGGWNVSGIVSAQSGANFSISNSDVDSNQDGWFDDRANYIGSGSIDHAINHKVSPADGYLSASDWAMLNTAALPCPANVNRGLWCEGKALGQMERNTLVGPRYFNTDFGFGKGFKITETSKLTLLGNFFNIFNHPNFLLPDSNLNDAATTFGKSTGTFAPGPGGARVTQLALRFDF